ncbi:Putative negative regulator of RcsB-dependent stress response [Solimonas aquatica]|uniref:Ancillary SecYEG translocon subunit n=1 Tax=Solimonas aquatica TaxID=489703 RepID=A0A1H9H759_9GAMM|nr:tetratricopeptide repeat protein [Solimonas aquatica]SEQ58140.1 Putative negative regulator of RcsB-dependent stress response [Solimonas aquatica]
MTTHYDDEAQADQLKKWLKENYLALAAGLAVGLSAVFGYQGWQNHKSQRGAAASQVYEDLKKELAAEHADLAKPLLDKLSGEYADTPYAAAAQLQAAAASVRASQFDEALTHLKWVSEHSKDEGLKQVAQLRQARVLWQQNKIDEALVLLKDDKGAFAALVQELRGDILVAKGDRAAARSDYEKALAATPEGQPNRMLLQRKLDDLSGAVQS